MQECVGMGGNKCLGWGCKREQCVPPRGMDPRRDQSADLRAPSMTRVGARQWGRPKEPEGRRSSCGGAWGLRAGNGCASASAVSLTALNSSLRVVPSSASSIAAMGRPAVAEATVEAELEERARSHDLSQGSSRKELSHDLEHWHHTMSMQPLLSPDLQESAGRFHMPSVNAFGQAFRAYDAPDGERQAGVEALYRTNHIHQTVAFGQAMRAKHLRLDKARMSIWECCELLNECVDDSDPDLEEPQIQHLLQTAEAIRLDHPHDDWFHLVGLVHDLGKVLLHPLFGAEPQYAVVGDTFPVGCAFDPAIVHAEMFKENPDSRNREFCTKLGIYHESCGLDQVVMSWGHDEYMFQVMKHNNTTLPPAALFVIRYHSFYAMHQAGAYKHLMNDSDHENFRWLQRFNKYDLYSKSKACVDVEAVKPYYQSLIQKYFPKVLRW